MVHLLQSVYNLVQPCVTLCNRPCNIITLYNSSLLPRNLRTVGPLQSANPPLVHLITMEMNTGELKLELKLDKKCAIS